MMCCKTRYDDEHEEEKLSAWENQQRSLLISLIPSSTKQSRKWSFFLFRCEWLNKFIGRDEFHTERAKERATKLTWTNWTVRALLPEINRMHNVNLRPAALLLTFFTYQHRLSQELQSCIHAFSKFWQIFAMILRATRMCTTKRRVSCDECDSRESEKSSMMIHTFLFPLLLPFVAARSLFQLVRRLLPGSFNNDSPENNEHFLEVPLTCRLYVFLLNAMLILLSA